MVPQAQKFVTYYRVSTAQQGRSGLGLEAQKAAVAAYLKDRHGVELASFTEVESGKVNTRPQLEAALLRCRQTHATLIVAKLDRLSRNVAFLMTLRESGTRFQALDIPDANTLTLTVMAALAQHEREIISARTKAALAARKARGLPLGTPRDMKRYAVLASVKGRATNTAKAKARANEIAPIIKEARADGCSTLQEIADYLNSRHVTTPRGREWRASSVRNVQRYIGPP